MSNTKRNIIISAVEPLKNSSECDAPLSRPNTLSIDPNDSSNCNTPFLIKEFLSPSNPFLTNLGSVSGFGNVILASPQNQNMTMEQLQADRTFYEKYKEIRAQQFKSEKETDVSTSESRIIIVSQNTLDQLNGVFSSSINSHTNQERKSLDTSVDNSNVLSMSKSTDYNTYQSDLHQYIPAAPSSASSTEFPSSSNYLGNEGGKSKIDKKRARNRDAARKCRERKLQLMKKLEKEVQDLIYQKSELESQARNQKKKIENLKSAIIQHLNNGCAM